MLTKHHKVLMRYAINHSFHSKNIIPLRRLINIWLFHILWKFSERIVNDKEKLTIKSFMNNTERRNGRKSLQWVNENFLPIRFTWKFWIKLATSDCLPMTASSSDVCKCDDKHESVLSQSDFNFSQFLWKRNATHTLPFEETTNLERTIILSIERKNRGIFLSIWVENGMEMLYKILLD